MAEKKNELKVDLKSVLKVVGLLYAVLIFVGILTYFVKPGTYIDGEYVPLDTITRVPWYRWLTAPIESFFLNSLRMKMYQIIALILILGGCFRVLEECGAMASLIKLIINKFRAKRFVSLWIITAFMMLITSFFGVQEELLILFPIFLSFAQAMKWSKITALAMVLITTSSGFTCALMNPYTVGTVTTLVDGLSIMDGIWFRAGMLLVMYVVTSLFMVYLAKQDEKKLTDEEREEAKSVNFEMTKEDYKKAWYVISLFLFALIIVVLFAAIPALEKLGLGMIIMGVAFVIGTTVIGIGLLGKFKYFGIAFLKGVKAILPSALVIITAFSITYLAERAQIIDTLFYYINGLIGNNPYLGVTIILVLVLLIEFFIPSATAKAGLIIPLLTAHAIPGISLNVILLCYILGDGYTNVIYPTCGTLMIGLGLAEVNYIDWMKKTGLYQIILFLFSLGFLYLAVFIGL